MEPLPWALMALPSVLSSTGLTASTPSLSVTLPPATKTMLPLLPVTRSLWSASVTVPVVAVLLNSVTLTVTVFTLSASSSVR